ncbi:MAG: MmcQ/YjbR family DNA-binding protein [Saprospiraceae bacterium]
MNVEEIREYCLSKPFTDEGFPFDESTLVFKVMNKIFAIMGLEQEDSFVNLKCDPDRAIELREEYEEVQPGWHMNKKHWNSVYIEKGLDHQLIKELIDHSYNLIVKSLPKKVKNAMC